MSESVGARAPEGAMYTEGGEARPGGALAGTIVVTGAAGFIGYSVARALLERGDRVIGVDNLNDYYDVSLKEARLALLSAYPGFVFAKLDVADRDGVFALVGRHRDLRSIIHLAAQAGV